MTKITKKYKIYFKNKLNTISNLKCLKYKMKIDITNKLISKHINNIKYLSKFNTRINEIVDRYFNILLLTYRK
jgi:hypothetical protein